MSKPTIEYTLTEIIDDDITLTKDWENSASTVDCIDGYTICFDVKATNAKGERGNFKVAFQPSDRNDRIMAYCGYEVDFASRFGFDGDESEELIEFLDHFVAPLNDLCDEALRLSSQILKEAQENAA